LDHIAAELQKLPETVLYEEPDKTYKVYRLEEDSYTVEQNEDGIFEVSGPYIEELCRHVNFQDTESLQYFQKQLRDKGVIADLEKAGVEEGDTIYLDGLEFEFIF
jgi:GTP-binding protein